jgi:hypothetical protein
MALIDDASTTARLEGYSWDQIGDHVADSAQTAIQEGYTAPELDTHTGFTADGRVNQRLTQDAINAFHTDEEGDHTSGLVNPENLGTDKPAVNALSEDQRQGYANALLEGATHGADDYSRQVADALQTPNSDQVAAGVKIQLPDDKALTDASIALANSMDAPSETMSAMAGSIREKLIQHWSDTGEQPMDALRHAEDNMEQGDTTLLDKLTQTAEPTASPPLDELAKKGRDAIVNEGTNATLLAVAAVNPTAGLLAMLPSMAYLPAEILEHDKKMEMAKSSGQYTPDQLAEMEKDDPRWNALFQFFAIPAAHFVGKVVLPEVAGSLPDLLHNEAGEVGPLFHGTPHFFHEAPEEGAPFGKFKLEAIGSGEGAQSYGHGLYFAENKGIAEHYRDVLSPPVREDNGSVNWTPGHLYEAHLPNLEPEHFLDWDKPLSAQSPHVQMAVAKVYQKIPFPEGADPEAYAKALIRESSGPGRDIYEGLASRLGDYTNEKAMAKAASEALAKEGIAGNRYLDASSRDQMRVNLEGAMKRQQEHLAAETSPEARKIYEQDIAQYKAQLDALPPESRNYVIFDPKEIRITGRDGVPAPTPEQAAGHVAARGMAEQFRDLISGLLKDERGSGANPIAQIFRNKEERDLANRNAQAKEDTKADLRELRGERNHTVALASAAVEKFRGEYNKQTPGWKEWLGKQGPGKTNYDPVTGQWDIHPNQVLMDHMEDRPGRPVTLDPKSPVFPLAEEMRRQNQFMRDLLEHKTPGFNEDGHIAWKDNYARHQWTQPNKANAQWSGRQGSSASFQKRTIPYAYDGLQIGLKPVHQDMIEGHLANFLGQLDFRNDFVAKQNALARGDLQWSHEGPPPGMKLMEGRGNERIRSWVDENGKAVTMPEQLYGYPGFVDPYMASVGRGIHGWQRYPNAGTIYDTISRYKNQTVAWLLNLPLYHLGNMITETMTAGFDQLVDRMGRLELGHAMQNLALDLPIIPRQVYNAVVGYQLRANYKNALAHPWLSDVTKALKLADYNFGDHGEVQIGNTGELPGWFKMIANQDVGRQMAKSFGDVLGKDGETMLKKIGMTIPRLVNGVSKELGRLQQMAVYPLMRQLVPILRNGKAAASTQDFLRRNPGVPQDALKAKMAEISDHVDNVFGEMNTDNIFMHKTAMQVAKLPAVSFSWAFGTYRAVGMGVKDLLTGLSGVATGGKYGDVSKLLSEHARWLFAFPLTMAYANTIMQYAHTGTTGFSTGDPKDFAFYRTGETDKDGAPRRGMMWGYTKDWTKWALAALTPGNALDKLQASAKTILGSWINNPLANITHDLSTGRDWAERNIHAIVQDLNHGKPATALQQLWYTLKTNLNPIALSQQQAAQKGSGLNYWERLAGMREAPKSVENPEAYAKTMEKVNARQMQDFARQEIAHQNNLETPDKDTIQALTDALAEAKTQLGSSSGSGTRTPRAAGSYVGSGGYTVADTRARNFGPQTYDDNGIVARGGGGSSGGGAPASTGSTPGSSRGGTAVYPRGRYYRGGSRRRAR